MKINIAKVDHEERMNRSKWVEGFGGIKIIHSGISENEQRPSESLPRDFRVITTRRDSNKILRSSY